MIRDEPGQLVNKRHWQKRLRIEQTFLVSLIRTVEMRFNTTHVRATMAHDTNLYDNEMNNIARKKNDVARLELK